MKYSIVFIILMLGVTTQMSAQKSTMDHFSIQVDGLGCPFCAYGLEKKFKEFKGIKNTAIDMETGMFTFEYPSDKELSMEKVENQVTAAGYTPVSTKIERANGIIENSAAIAPSEINEGSIIKEEEIFVAGNCGMCKSRIEKAAKSLDGVSEASWNKKSKMLSLSFDSNAVSIEKIEEAIAQSGHDTKTAKAEDDIYDNLPACCLYDRE